jgi:SecD/SecF fusion protein
MNQNQLPKIILILVLVALSAWTLYPPSQRLKQGIDLAGGTSLIYEIDTQGLEPAEERGLAARMITVLRRRIDPANIQNLVWRPQGNTRFEIQMPLASADTRKEREAYKNALDALLAQNVSPVSILQSLKKTAAERSADFERYAPNDPNRLSILKTLEEVYDARKALQEQRDASDAEMGKLEAQISAAGMNVDTIRRERMAWTQLTNEALAEATKSYADPNLLQPYVAQVRQWAEAVGELTDPNEERGKNAAYVKAVRALDKLSLTSEQLTVVLDMEEKSEGRVEALAALNAEFPDRADLIDQVATAFDTYRPHRGQLDDPADLQRMLKGAGILEWRILPTIDGGELAKEEQTYYLESLTTKGPKANASSEYIWCEVEDPSPEAVSRWVYATRAIIGEFGSKAYVLACNKVEKTMLRGTGENEWKLERANASQDSMGRRAIGFGLDQRGALKFAQLTGENIDKPLCILLDDVALSAPGISQRIFQSGIITGSFTETEVSDMVNKLNAGSLPARLIEQPISVKTIGPSIGEENRNQGVRAGFIGFIVVMICMLAYYLKAGAIADVALFMNVLFVLGIMAGVSATFTLPGIAGIILTIGMSVDANVLIFERIREEQEKGSSLANAIKNGYQRAFRTIFDANLTTFITGAILYWVASEEIKGFAIVLMLGIVSSMFTALFVTRVVFDWMIVKKLLKEKLVMLRIIHQPNINWMGSRPIFFGISGVLVVGGLFVFFTCNNKFDIEFTGGTSVQVNLKESSQLERQDVLDKVTSLTAANVYSIGDTNRQFEITTTDTNRTVSTISGTGANQTADTITKAIKKAQANFRGSLSNLAVSPGTQPNVFDIQTSQVNASLVKNVLAAAFPDSQISEPQVDEVVNSTIKAAFVDDLEIQQSLQPEALTDESTEKITETMIEAYPVLANSLGGIKIDISLGQAATAADLDQRIKDLRFKPDMRHIAFYPYEILGADLLKPEQDEALQKFVYVSLPPEAGLRELSADEWARFETNERTRVEAAASMAESLPRVTQIDPSVGGEQKKLALIAIFLSLSAIVGYIWVRFGDLRYGLAAIAALVHDVCITLGAVTACSYITGHAIGDILLIGDFKINLAMIAAFLTLIGYSLNDTIVVFDRIRENRHKAQLTPQTITNSINQTISRTLLTSFTTFIVVLIMYIFGGEGLRGFTFAIGFGVIVGTYSSIAIAAPILLIGKKTTPSNA